MGPGAGEALCAGVPPLGGAPPVARFHLVSPACARRHAATALREPRPLPQPRRWPPQAVPGGYLASPAIL